jgi:FKBP-type peptidyl-prolyl cis-trans isomerase
LPQSRKRRTGKGRRTYKGAAPSRSAAQDKGASSKAALVFYIALTVIILGGVIYFVAFRKASNTEVTTTSGLKYVDQVEGTGASPQPGKTVTVHYTGTLDNGTKFDSSRDKGQPFSFVIGTGRVIKGWDEGVMSMKVGGKRKLIVPPQLGYGASGSPPRIPPNSTLNFDVELLDVK